MTRFVARAEALLLVAVGALGLWFSAAESYTRLMSPEFRWLTAAGGALIVAMGAALLVRPRAHPRPAASVVLGSFAVFAASAVGAAGDGQLLVAPEVEAGEARREGYELVETGRFVDGFSEGAQVPDGARVAVTGFVHRTESLDTVGRYMLLSPRMACCVADALALGVQVDGAADRMPEEGEWVTLFATARVASSPVETPPFRVGPILFTVVSRTHVLGADEAVPVRSLLPDVVGRIPADRCASFLGALEATGLARELRGEGPFTLLCPLDESFAAAAPEEGDALFAYLRRFVILGDLRERDLFGVSELPTLDGRAVAVQTANGRVLLGGSRLLFGDQRGRNGMVHVVHPAWPHPPVQVSDPLPTANVRTK